MKETKKKRTRFWVFEGHAGLGLFAFANILIALTFFPAMAQAQDIPMPSAREIQEQNNRNKEFGKLKDDFEKIKRSLEKDAKKYYDLLAQFQEYLDLKDQDKAKKIIKKINDLNFPQKEKEALDQITNNKKEQIKLYGDYIKFLRKLPPLGLPKEQRDKREKKYSGLNYEVTNFFWSPGNLLNPLKEIDFNTGKPIERISDTDRRAIITPENAVDKAKESALASLNKSEPERNLIQNLDKFARTPDDLEKRLQSNQENLVNNNQKDANQPPNPKPKDKAAPENHTPPVAVPQSEVPPLPPPDTNLPQGNQSQQNDPNTQAPDKTSPQGNNEPTARKRFNNFGTRISIPQDILNYNPDGDNQAGTTDKVHKSPPEAIPPPAPPQPPTANDVDRLDLEYAKARETWKDAKKSDPNCDRDPCRTARAAKEEKQKELSRTKKEVSKINSKQSRVSDIMEYHETYGGKFGGQDIGTTMMVNEGTQQLSNVAKTIAQSDIVSKQNQIQVELASKGANVNAADFNEAQKKLAEQATKGLNTAMYTEVANGAVQGTMAAFHLFSKKKVTNAARVARSALLAEKANIESECANNFENEPCKTQLAEVNFRLDNVRVNEPGEKAMQDQYAIQQFGKVANSAMQAANYGQQAKAVNALTMANQNAGPYNTQLNPGPVMTGFDLPPNPENPAGVQNALVDDMPGLNGNDPQFNEADPRGVPDAPIPGSMAGQPGGPAAGGGAGGLGGGGGTSPAKTENDSAPPAKKNEEAAGRFASADNASGGKFGSRGSDSGSGAVVKDDNSLADLLKKFLPGAPEEPKKQDPNGNLAENDRSPASDQAAVIGRNKNIFHEVHKRYELKAKQGAVVF